MLIVDDERGKGLGRIGQGRRRERVAAAHMGQVRPDRAAGRGSAYRMTAAATAGQKQLLAPARAFVLWWRCVGGFALQPGLECRRCLGYDMEGHEGMRPTAILCTLARDNITLHYSY